MAFCIFRKLKKRSVRQGGGAISSAETSANVKKYATSDTNLLHLLLFFALQKKLKEPVYGGCWPRTQRILVLEKIWRFSAFFRIKIEYKRIF